MASMVTAGQTGSETARLHARVRGRVQGVFFRATTRDQARRLGLTGWVRNCPDGTVELVAEGPREACQELLRFCRQGPPAARVEEVDARWEEPAGEFEGFQVRH